MDRDGAGRGEDPEGARHLGADAGETGAQPLHANRRRSGTRARGGNRASGPEARERHGDQGRPGQDPGLRVGEADANGRGRRGRLAAANGDGDLARSRPRHGLLHVAGAGVRASAGLSVGSVLAGRDGLRDGDGQARVREGERSRHTLGDPARGTAAADPGGAAGSAAAFLGGRALPGQGAGGSLRVHEGPRPRPGESARPSLASELVGFDSRRAVLAASLVAPADRCGTPSRRSGVGRLRVAASAPGAAPLPPPDVSARSNRRRAFCAGWANRRLRRRLGRETVPALLHTNRLHGGDASAVRGGQHLLDLRVRNDGALPRRKPRGGLARGRSGSRAPGGCADRRSGRPTGGAWLS